MYLHLSIILLGFVVISPLAVQDLYETLGVSRSAKQNEIRSAYRRLAMKWHPDKNPSEEAEKNFLDITKAYEILSNAEKRKEYDTFGTIDSNAVNYEQRSPFFHHGFDADMLHDVLGDFFQPFRQFTREKNIVKIDFRAYRLDHLPATRTTPLLLLGYSHFCFACQRVRPVWSRLAEELTPLGVTVSVANIQDDHALREELRLLHTPGIIAVIDSKITYFVGTHITRETVLEFFTSALLESSPSRSAPVPGILSSNLGAPLITLVRGESHFAQFHDGWREDSRARAVFFKPSPRPPLRFCMAAFRAVDYLAVAFVNTQPEAGQLLARRLDISAGQEALVILHEAPEPVFSYSTGYLSRAIIDSAMLQHSRLSVPRILSPARLLDICPVDGRPPSSAFASVSEVHRSEGAGGRATGHSSHRHLCITLLLHSGQASGVGDLWLSTFRSALAPIPHTVASSLGIKDRLPKDFTPILSPAYMFRDKQASWWHSILQASTCRQRSSAPVGCPGIDSHSSNIDGHLVALWRISTRLIAFKLLPRNAGLHPSELLLSNATTLTNDDQHRKAADTAAAQLRSHLKTILSDLLLNMPAVADFARRIDPTELVSGLSQLPPDGWALAYVPNLEGYMQDEMATPLWLRIKRKAWALVVRFLSYLEEFFADPIGFLLSSTLLIALFFGYSLYRVVKDVLFEGGDRVQTGGRKHSSSREKPANSTTRPPERFVQTTQRQLVSLTPSTYDGLVRHSPPGKMTLILCTDSSPMGNRLANHFSQIVFKLADDSLVASRLSVDRYPRWLGWILESATNIPFRPQNEAEETYNRTTLTFNPANCRGTVLAVNSRRRYFSVYHPLLPGSGPRAVSEDEDDEENVENLVPVRGSNRDALRYRNFNKLLNLETDDVDDEDFEESSDASESSLRHRPPDGPLLEQELLHGLCVWLDRLFEGSLRRYHVRDWPTTLVMTDHEEYDRV
uniref:DnaJ homolog subfamily C member 16 n=4 Tax=Schistocephalus solidus TaxID=70667 RepID=A0A0X3PJW4_SCHSO